MQTARFIETRLARLGLSFEQARQKALRIGRDRAAASIFPDSNALRSALASMLHADALSRA